MSSMAPCKVPIGSPSGLSSGVMGKGCVGCAQGLRQGDLARTAGLGVVVAGAVPGLPFWAARVGGLHALHRLAEHVGGQRFGAHAEVKCLLRGHDADGAAPFEPAVEGELGRENGGEGDQDERDDERDAALAARRLGRSRAGAAPLIRRPRSAGERVPSP